MKHEGRRTYRISGFLACFLRDYTDTVGFQIRARLPVYEMESIWCSIIPRPTYELSSHSRRNRGILLYRGLYYLKDMNKCLME